MFEIWEESELDVQSKVPVEWGYYEKPHAMSMVNSNESTHQSRSVQNHGAGRCQADADWYS